MSSVIISGIGVREMGRLALSRGLQRVICSDNGKEACGEPMFNWAHELGMQPRLSSQPNQNAYVESINGSPAR